MIAIPQVLNLARFHVADNATTETSARACLADAVKLFDDGLYDWARIRALRSLSFSVGMHSPVYARAAR